MAPKDYEYAFDGLKIIASPKLPANHGLNMSPATNAEVVAVLNKAMALKDAIGPTREFLLG
jgi:hypothetical protein